MANQDNRKKQTTTESQTAAKGGAMGKVAPWVITGAVVLALGGLGFLAGRMFGTRGSTRTVAAGEQSSLGARLPPAGAGDATPGWYYDLDSVVANLNEPGVTRYVRIGLTLEINAALDHETTRALLEQKKPLLKHWLTLYLSNQTLEDIRGEKNLRRMQAQLSDAINEGLFPDAAPQIKRVLFKEFSIQ